MNCAGKPTVFRSFPSTEKMIEEFERFCSVDLQLAAWSVKTYRWIVMRLVRWLSKPAWEATVEDIRGFLEQAKEKYAPKHYANILISLRRFYRDFLRQPDLMASFVFPHIPFKPVQVPRGEQIHQFFAALNNDRQRAMFLMFASSGLRCSELLGLRKVDIDFDMCKIVPQPHATGRTKNSPHFTFYNEEASEYLAKYLSKRHDDDPRLFKIGSSAFRRSWKHAMKRSSVKVYPQGLRQWFCQALTEKGVSDRYIDFFCGRSPKSVLARHYTDYSPERLKQIYEKANTKVLNATPDLDEDIKEG